MKTYNILKILSILLNNQKTTSNKLAEELEVSQRTIKRYLVTMEALDIPINLLMGKKGGIELDINEFKNRFNINKHEIDFICDSLFFNEGLFKSITGKSNLHDLLKVLKIDNYLEIDFSKWETSNSNDLTFSILKSSIISCKQVEFDYLDMNNSFSHRIINPYKLAFKENSWYVLGFCHLRKNNRIFKIKKIRNIKSLDIKFKHPDNASFDFRRYFKESEKIFLELLICKRVTAKAYEDFEQNEISDFDENYLLVKSHRISNPNLISLILSYGGNAKVLSPKRIIPVILENYEELKKIYKGDSF